MSILLFTHSPVDENSSCFQIFAILTNATIKIHFLSHVEHVQEFLCGNALRSGKVRNCSTLKENDTLFSKEIAHIYTSISSGSDFLVFVNLVF